MKDRFIIAASFLGAFLLLNTALIKITSAQNAEKQQTLDCTRSTPAPVVKKSVFLRTTFNLSRDKRTGTETVKFDNGDKLTITNGGCEYYYLGFRFETDRFSARPTDTKYWYHRAAELIKQTEKGIDAPVRLNDAAKALEKYVKKTRKPKFGEEIDYGDSEIRTFVTVNKIKKLAKGKFLLEVAFAVGPL